MHKNSALGAARIPYNSMEEVHYISKDSVAWSVKGLMSGKYLITAFYTISTGSNCGSLRAALLSYFAGCPATVEANLTASRITGLNKLPKSKRTTPKSNTWSMMPPTFIKRGVY